MKIKTLLLFVFIFAISCERDETKANDVLPGITEYKPHYMDNNYFRNLFFYDGENVKLEYSNSRIHKKISHLKYLYANNIVRELNIVDELTYKGNEIEITRKSLDSLRIEHYSKRIFKKPATNQISQIIINQSNTIDTLKFSYTNNNVLDHITVHGNGVKSKAKFYYNRNNNLDSIVTKYGEINFTPNKGYYYSYDETRKVRQKEVFTDFDSSQNPLKELVIFDDTFNRSLSNNNYQSYKTYFYDKDNVVRSISEQKWDFVYVNNQIDFSK